MSTDTKSSAPNAWTQRCSLTIQFSCSAVSDSLRPHGLQHARLPCPSPIPGAFSHSCPLSWWCHPTISSSVVPFFSHLQSFPASGCFPMSVLHMAVTDKDWVFLHMEASVNDFQIQMSGKKKQTGFSVFFQYQGQLFPNNLGGKKRIRGWVPMSLNCCQSCPRELTGVYMGHYREAIFCTPQYNMRQPHKQVTNKHWCSVW